MREREEVEHQLQRYSGDYEDYFQRQVIAELLLDIRDLLVDLYNRDADVKIEPY